MTDPADLKAKRDYLVQQLEDGTFENVLLLFESLPDYDQLLPDLAADLSIRVRSGIYRLLLEMEGRFDLRLAQVAPAMAAKLDQPEPTLRGDLCSALGLVGTMNEIEALEPLIDDPNAQVAELASEAIDEILERNLPGK
ncbi:MAG: hypothetical protein RRB13_16095 [bacterium]|nr:hypothetical protein [bacterium]